MIIFIKRTCTSGYHFRYFRTSLLVVTTNKKEFVISTSDIRYIEWMRGDFVLFKLKKLYYFNVPIIDDDFISIINKLRDNHMIKIGLFLKSDLKND
jgi:hypothetical protein